MGIRATGLTVQNFRSFEAFDLALDAGVTILVGRNAAGKTNLVEALQLTTAAQSFRRPSPAELVREGARSAAARLELVGDGRVLDIECRVEAGRRQFAKNGKRAKPAEVRGILPSVLFCPDHLDLVKRGASARRSALDDFGIQLNAQYAKLLSAYERVVEQRNNLLKEYRPPLDLLSAWDDALVSAGCALLRHRRALLERLSARIVEVYAAIAPHETIGVRYMPSIAAYAEESLEVQADACADAPASRDLDDEELFRYALECVRADELRRGITLVGPHRDEVLFTIDGRPARDFASQGQQRSVVLAWKIAEVEVTRDILGRYPLLLLDDVMSELDASRRASIMGFIADEIQTVITTTNLGYFTDGTLDSAEVVRIGEEI